MTMSDRDASIHKWTFTSRFRRDAFGWRSAPAHDARHDIALTRKMFKVLLKEFTE